MAQAARVEDEEREKRLRHRLKTDFAFYGPRCLHIRTKKGKILPFEMNRSQRFLHERIEEQKARTGRVRIIVLKGRQVGISTYIGGRDYWITTHNKGFQSFILAHEDKATQNLYDMQVRYHENCPAEMKPQTGKANAKELKFSILDSGFKHATAGTKEVGRSSTIQVFHGSEVGFWPNAEGHLAGIMQAIADEPGTEAILESTANGIGNVFYTTWKNAERGISDFEAVFIPWFWHEEYARPIPLSGFDPSPAWCEYQELHGLTIEQLFWAYRKNLGLLKAAGGDPDKPGVKFKQEFPATADEAFETSGEDCFIPPLLVLRARKASVKGHGPIILGVDCARGGGDLTAMIDRQGRRMGGHICFRKNYGHNVMPIAAEVMRIIPVLRPLGLKKVCIDITGLGSGVYDRLTELVPWEWQLLEPVNFGEGAWEELKYANRRAEMWDLMRDWVGQTAPVQVPDSDEFQGDLTALKIGPAKTHYRSNGQLVMQPKQSLLKELGFSPDLGDAGALTFAPDMSLLYMETKKKSSDDAPSGSAWTT